MTETELLQGYGMGKHEFRQYEGGEGCSCGREWQHEKRHQHTPSDPEPGCEYCEEMAK